MPLLIGPGGPDAGEAVGLQFDLHLQVVRFGLARGALLLLIRLSAAGHHLGAPDQDARIDAKRVADDPEHHDRADAEPAAAQAHGQAEAAATAAAAIAAAILDVLAFRHVVETHLVLL